MKEKSHPKEKQTPPPQTKLNTFQVMRTHSYPMIVCTSLARCVCVTLTGCELLCSETLS